MQAALQVLSYLFDYMAWADSEVLDACAQLNPEELDRDLGDSHHGIFGTLQHMFIAEHDWLARLRHSMTSPTTEVPRALLFPSPNPGPDLPGLHALWPTVWRGFREYIAALPESALEVEFVAMSHWIPRGKLLLHVTNHATLHRGQVIAMFRQLGHQPPSTDLFTYHRFHPSQEFLKP
jgi:uncharacterized damage-inducible protein DinB